MNKSVIVYGPQGCGKTLNAEHLRRHFLLDEIHEGLPEKKRHKFREKPSIELAQVGVLYLTNHTREQLVAEGVIDADARRVFSFDEAMAQTVVPRDKQKLRVKRLHPDAIVPKYQTAGAAAFDLHSIESGRIDGARTFCTGLAYEVPEGYVMLIYSRSGQGFKHDVRLANCTGVIDSDYRGEMLVRLTEDAGAAPAVEKGDRIAQALLVKIDQWDIVEVDELSSTERGDGRFGSTGR